MAKHITTYHQTRIVIYGAGLGGKIVSEMLSFDDHIRVIGFIDDNPAIWGQHIFGLEVMGGREKLQDLQIHDQLDSIIVSIASPGAMDIRTSIYIELKDAGFQFINAIHPTAVVSPSAVLGENNIVSPGVIIDTEAQLGNNNRLCAHFSQDHHSVIGNHNFFGSKCSVSSLAKVGDRCVIGLGVGIAPLIVVGNDVHVTSGNVVTQPLSDGTHVFQSGFGGD